jgi:NAD(P)H-dependent FMN reductase
LRALPHFNLDIESQQQRVPEAVVAWRDALNDCDAVLIASPEHGHSLPGVLKNGIDWTIGSGELNRKVTAITAAVVHPDRGKRGLRALRGTLYGIDANVVWEEAMVRDADQEKRIHELLASLVAGAKRSAG